MRLLFNLQKALDFSPYKSRSKVIRAYEGKNDRISQLLDENLPILKAVSHDFSCNKKLKRGRKGYTAEQAFRF